MPITLTLTDDQALEIVAQIGQVLAKKQEAPPKTTVNIVRHPPPYVAVGTQGRLDLPEIKIARKVVAFKKGRLTASSQVRTFVENVTPGDTFKFIDLCQALNLPFKRRPSASAALGILQKLNVVTMVARGTWKRNK